MLEILEPSLNTNLIVKGFLKELKSLTSLTVRRWCLCISSNFIWHKGSWLGIFISIWTCESSTPFIQQIVAADWTLKTRSRLNLCKLYTQGHHIEIYQGKEKIKRNIKWKRRKKNGAWQQKKYNSIMIQW